MKELLQHIYNGILRFSPVRKYFKFKSNYSDMFPKVGFLTTERKEALEKILGTSISKTEFFEQALTHRSYLQVASNNKIVSNERLEFLGDAILGMITAEYLFSLHRNVPEGDLTKMRSWLVNKNSLAECAKNLHLDGFLKMSFSASKSLESGSDSILADAFEAIIAAVYLDSGLDAAVKFVADNLNPMMLDRSSMIDKNYKSILLEKVQAIGKESPHYLVLSEMGPDHNKEFKIAVYVDDKCLGEGNGKSKKEAEQAAAQAALEKNNLDLLK